MRSIGIRRAVVGGALVVAIAGASFSAVLFIGGDNPGTHKVESARAAGSDTTTTSSTTTSTTTTTTTTTAPPPDPAPAAGAAPAPAPAPQPAPPPAPDPEPAPAPPAPAGCSGGGGVIGAHNADRAAAGLAGLCANGQLAGFAQNWANQMAATQSLVHQDIGALINSTSFSTMGENILSGPGDFSPGQMESAWMNSPSHRANILNGAYSQVGVGVAYSSDGRVWVCVDFGG
jgi:uncharacterized protein YkwD